MELARVFTHDLMMMSYTIPLVCIHIHGEGERGNKENKIEPNVQISNG